VRVLILVDCYLPIYKSGAKQIHDLGIEFRRRGYDVSILTTTHDAVQPFSVCIEDGLRILRVKTRKIKGASKTLRGLHEARLSSLVWRRAGKYLAANPGDLIVFYSPTIFWGALVRRLKALWGAPACLILRDIFPEWAVDIGLLKRGLIYRYFHKNAVSQYDNSDVIAVQSAGDLRYFTRRFRSAAYRLEVLYNWSSLQESNLPRTQYRSRLGLQNKVVFFYGGNLGAAQDISNILRLAASLAVHQRIHFLIVGEGNELLNLRSAIADRGLRNILVLPPVEQREYLSMVSEFDIGLVTLDRRLTNHNIPGKLLAYLYWGIPVLASINSGNDLFELIGKGPSGFCLENGQDEMLSSAALRLSADPHLRARMGKNARSLLEQTFSVEKAVQQILEAVGKAAPSPERLRVRAPDQELFERRAG
jgi:O26-antigen biosynthesis N-acetyl-L-fucosamine transferase